MILVIDATVSGPDWVATGSAAVTVSTPAPAQEPSPPASVVPSAELANLRMRQRWQALRWGANPA